MHNGKDVLGNNFPSMGWICKEGLRWDFFIMIYFECLSNLASGTYWFMLENSSHCSGIVSYNGINDIRLVTEFIVYHLQNFISLHAFRSPLKSFWALMLLCLFPLLIHIITLQPGLLTHNYTNNTRGYSSYDEGIYARGVISTSRLFLLPVHIICNDEFYLIFIYWLIWYSTPLHTWLISVWYFLQFLSISPDYQTSFHLIIFLGFFEKPCQGKFRISKRFVNSIPLPSILCIPNIHWKLILYHLEASYRIYS